MPRKKFTARSIAAIKAPEQGQIDWWDSSFPGFGMRVSFGGRKVWQVMYRHGNRKRRMKLGPYPALSLADARELAIAALRDAALGKDPAAAKKAERMAGTFKELASEYMEQYAKKEKRSWKKDQSMLDHDILPAIGTLKAKDVTRLDIIRLLDSTKNRGAPVMANRVHEVVRRVYSWGMARDDNMLVNPAVGIERHKEQAREVVLKDDEIKNLWETLDNEAAIVEVPFKLQLLTAQRGGEIKHMRRSDIGVEQDGLWWTIPGEFSKNGKTHRVPLPDQAAAVLLKLAGVETVDEFLSSEMAPDWVFASQLTYGPLANIWKPVTGLRKNTGIEFTPHDLRRTAASKMTGMGISRLTVGKILNHSDPSVTSIYDRHSYDAEKRQALAAWGQRLTEIVTGEMAAKVVPLRPA